MKLSTTILVLTFTLCLTFIVQINSCTILNFGNVYNSGSESTDLYKVSKAAYDSCSSITSSGVKITTTDSTYPNEIIYTFDSDANEGYHYFTSSLDSNCERGQRFKVELIYHNSGSEGLFAVQTTSYSSLIPEVTGASCYDNTSDEIYRAINVGNSQQIRVEKISKVDGTIIWTRVLEGEGEGTIAKGMYCVDNIVYVLGQSMGGGYLCGEGGCNANDGREVFVQKIRGADGALESPGRLIQALGEDYPSAITVDDLDGSIYVLVTHSDSPGKLVQISGRYDQSPFEEWVYRLNPNLSTVYLRKITTNQAVANEQSNARDIITKAMFGPINFQNERFLIVGVDTSGELSSILPPRSNHNRHVTGVIQRLNSNFVEGVTPSNEEGLRLQPGNPNVEDVENLRDFVSGFCWDQANSKIITFGSTTGSMAKGSMVDGYAEAPQNSLTSNTGNLDAFLCTISPTLSSNYQCSQFGSSGDDYASGCSVVSGSAFLLGTANGAVNGFGERWFGGADLFTRTFNATTLDATEGQQFGTPYEDFASDEYRTYGGIHLTPSGSGFITASTNGALVSGVTNKNNVYNPVVSKIFGDETSLFLPSALTSPSTSPNNSKENSNGSGISTAGIVCMSIFIPIGVALIVFGGYFFGKTRTERKYSAMAEKYGDVELGGMTMASTYNTDAPAGQKAHFAENQQSPSRSVNTSVTSGYVDPPRDSLFTPDPIHSPMQDVSLSSNSLSPPSSPAPPPSSPTQITPTPVPVPQPEMAPFPPQATVAPDISSFSISSADFEDAESDVTSAADII
ncbi:hypothetical protein TrLO_g14094 [Triparma laevis f. longispina]|uniref:Uncharacterized protein n=1 Tax=Triparma laevis f. longispina TaxID=1714387 RepID=A0A9W7F6A0_9STRA|nr:hypothetical protein TrLO_g14094 [Triparma laevis f. longispina]